MDEKIMTQHPQGKQGVNISRAKYNTIKTAILDVLQKDERLTFTQLADQINAKLEGNFDGSIGWYVTVVKLDLEARNIIERIPKTKPEQLRVVGK
jgi:hypothetical protein